MEHIHDDVLSAALDYYTSKMSNGEHLEPSEFQDMIKIINERQNRIREGLAESTEFFASVEKNAYETSKRFAVQSMLFDCFLKIHNLDYEFDLFCERVEARRLKSKRRTAQL